jgi:arylsulfate sulfotransferase
MFGSREIRLLALLFLLAAAVSCAAGPPAVRGELAVVTPNESVPLARVVEFATNQPAVATVTVSDGSREWTVPTPDTAQVEHSVPIVGLLPATTHTITVALRNEAGEASAAPATATFDTAPLPDDFPPIEVEVSDPSRMEPGLTVFPVSRWYAGQQDVDFGLAVAVNARGEVVWFYRTDHLVSDLNRTERGTLLYSFRRGAVEIDFLGNVINTWFTVGLGDELPEGAIPLDIDLFHHEVTELPSGEMLGLGTEVREFEDYPLTAGFPREQRGKANLVGDVVIQFRHDGTITREWKLLDILDPYRLCYGSLGKFYDQHDYAHIEGGTNDWSHANAVVVDPADGNLIISARHQDAVFKVDRETGELVWILGDPSAWTGQWQQYLLQPADGDLQWPYHQHSPTITPAGTLLVFDNGTYRAIPPAPRVSAADNHSRVVEYEIDEEAMTVRQLWVYGEAENERFYTPFLGDAVLLPESGNVLIAEGGHVVDAEGRLVDIPNAGWHWARIREVTRTDPSETVFEIVLPGEIGGLTPGWSIFRAWRWEGLD